MSSSSAAAEELQIVFGDTKQIPDDAARWVVCFRWDQASDYKYVSNIRQTTYGGTRGELTWHDFVVANYELSDKLYGGCNVEESEKDAVWRRGVFTEHDPNFPKTLVEVTWTGPIAKPKNAVATDRKGDKASKTPADAAAAQKDAGPSAAELAAERRAEAERRFQEKQAKYEADMKAWQAELDEQKAEEERKQAKLQAAKAEAAKALATFEEQQEAHRKEREKYAQLLLEHHSAQQRRALCAVGDKAACAAVDKPVAAAAQNVAGKASTDTDARQCVSEPVVSDSKVWKNALQAVVTNGCPAAVDVRICFLRNGGKWNCGVQWGVQPQDQWTWWSTETAGEIFWDARTSGSSRQLGSPQS